MAAAAAAAAAPAAAFAGKARPPRVFCGAIYAARGCMLFLLLLGLLANLTVIGSVEFFGVVPFSSLMARSASKR